ncbi:MAG: PLD nuclease N-terminal domain-containing protein [Acidimicrobiia bacterium]
MLFELEGLVGVLVVGFWIWALIDCITTDAELCRNLPKAVWLIFVVLLFDLGAILWLLLGRPPRKHWRPVASPSDLRAPRRPIGVDDRIADDRPAISDRMSAELDRRLAEWEATRGGQGAIGRGPEDPALASREAELGRREAELRRREQELEARERAAGEAADEADPS